MKTISLNMEQIQNFAITYAWLVVNNPTSMKTTVKNYVLKELQKSDCTTNVSSLLSVEDLATKIVQKFGGLKAKTTMRELVSIDL